jgi:Reverse transcriptase (RNA-dependent DNA polymerase)
VDNLDTYAPVVKLASIRILLALAAIYGFEIHQMDVVTAFLAGELEEEIYMEQTEGFRVGTDKEDLVCLLRKSLYGLKQAPRVWNRKTRRFLESIGFIPTYSDPCVYVNKETGVIIAMWVDDLVIFGKNLGDIEDLKTKLKAEYEMKDLGELKYFLGVQVHCDKARKLIHINQSRYNRMILERFGIADSKATKAPFPGGAQLTKAITTETLMDQKEYQSMVGSLMYATRPDLAQCIQQISQYS